MATVASPVLVSGSHRSGTTWVGRMLEASGSFAYLHEPFNPEIPRPGFCDAPFRGFTFVHPANEASFKTPIERTLQLRYRIDKELRTCRTRKQVRQVVAAGRRASQARRAGLRPLMKDPIALFSAEWLADTFGMQVVIMIRHPAAFVSSIMRVGWTHDFGKFLDQPELVKVYLQQHRERLEALRGPHDPFDGAVLAWVVTHEVIRVTQQRRPDWQFIRHEDLSAAPIEGFRAMYRALDVEMTPAAEAVIRKHSSADNPTEAPEGDPYQIQRDSAGNIEAWRSRLTDDEVGRVQEGTTELARHFYPDVEW
ncbi:MAG: sulfotransferase [Acidimicrobiia bacterium]